MTRAAYLLFLLLLVHKIRCGSGTLATKFLKEAVFKIDCAGPIFFDWVAQNLVASQDIVNSLLHFIWEHAASIHYFVVIFLLSNGLMQEGISDTHGAQIN